MRLTDSSKYEELHGVIN